MGLFLGQARGQEMAHVAGAECAGEEVAEMELEGSRDETPRVLQSILWIAVRQELWESSWQSSWSKSPL